MAGTVIFFFLFGFFHIIIEQLFKIPLDQGFRLYGPDFFNPQSDENLINSSAIIIQLGITLFFIIIGVLIDFKQKIIKNQFIRFFLVAFLECTAIFLFLNIFGSYFLAGRMALYIPIPGCIFGAIGINELKKVFPKIFLKKPKVQKILAYSLLISLISSYSLGVIYVRNSMAVQEEIDALDWFKTTPDYPKLTNKNTTDINIICNNHLQYWARYKIHYNIYTSHYGFTSLSSLKLDKNLGNLRKQAKEKLYIFISSNKEYFQEDWTMDGLIEFFEQYSKLYPFICTN